VSAAVVVASRVARHRGRFAPSPTGPLHFGSLVAALASYCDARAAGGEWLVRIEDVDEPRSRAGAESAILDALTRYGFAWDGPVVRQSERSAEYEQALARLRTIGAVYRACARGASSKSRRSALQASASILARAAMAWRANECRVRSACALTPRPSHSSTGCRDRNGRISRATSAISSFAAPTVFLPISSPWSSTTRFRA
jgi:glutamyl/glutaminyl-tRNA synthetase